MAGEAFPEPEREEQPGADDESSSPGDDGEQPEVEKPELGEPVVVDGPIRSARSWLFLVGDRLVVAGVLLLGVLVVLTAVDFALGIANPTQPVPLFYLFGGLIGGNFTLITIVLSINQLVVSQQIGAPGELRDKIEATNAYREAVEESVDVSVAPVTPTEFLHLLLRSTAEAVESIRDESWGIPDEDATEELIDATDEIYGHVDYIESLLRRDDVSVFQALSATLETNYSKEMNRLRQLRSRYEETYPESVVDCLDDLVVRFQQIDVARQYLKTIYIQDELSRLSRSLLYVGIPAVLVAAVVLRTFAAPESAVVTPALVRTSIPLATTVAIAPLAVLFSYILRLSTVSQRTVAITPFTTAAQERI